MIYFKKKSLLIAGIIHIILISLVLWYYYKSAYAFSMQEINVYLKDLFIKIIYEIKDKSIMFSIMFLVYILYSDVGDCRIKEEIISRISRENIYDNIIKKLRGLVLIFLIINIVVIFIFTKLVLEDVLFLDLIDLILPSIFSILFSSYLSGLVYFCLNNISKNKIISIGGVIGANFLYTIICINPWINSIGEYSIFQRINIKIIILILVSFFLERILKKIVFEKEILKNEW